MSVFKLQGASAMFAELFYIMENNQTSDGGGGYLNEWITGIEFTGAMAIKHKGKDSSTEERIAEAQDYRTLFTLAVPVDVPLSFDDYIYRQKDGTYYRVIGNPADKQTHTAFPIQEKQVSIITVRELPE